MKKIASIIRFSAGFLAVLVLVGLFGGRPVQANALTVERDDGIWLWPLPASTLNSVQDWAGCTGSSMNCIFCDTAVVHPCSAASHSRHLGHAGIDMGVVVGTDVYAAAAGKVVVYAYNDARGNTLVMEHEYKNGYSYYSYYEHLNSAVVSVDPNKEWPAGTHIAESGQSGVGYQPHLHFSIVFGPSNSIHSLDDVTTFEYGPGMWLWKNTYEMGRIIVNPAATNEVTIKDLPSGNLGLHKGSVHYTCDPSHVKIGMSETTGAVASANSPWRYSGTPQNILWQNMVNDEVKWLQQALNVTMNAGLTVDGSFGPTTREALVAYQLKHGIGSDGMFGPESNAHMVNQLKILGYLSDGTYHEHVYTNYVSNGDDTHTAQCKVCEYADAEHTGLECSGGTATGTTPATCEYCGEEYGETLSIGSVNNLVATSGSGTAELTWDAVSGAKCYSVYMKTVAGAVTLVQSNISTNRYTVTGLANGTTVGFVVRAYGNNVWSDWSTTVWTTPQAVAVAPENLTTVTGSGEVTVSWDPVPGAQVYALFLKRANGEVVLIHNRVNDTSYKVTGLANGTTVGFVVKSYVGKQWSGWSTTVWATPQVEAVAPTNLRTVAGDGQVTVSWDPVPGAQVYALFLKRANGEVVLIHNRVNGTSYTVTGCQNGVSVGFVVKSYAGKKWSGWSTTAWTVPMAE